MSLLTFGRSDPRWLVLILVLSALSAVGLALLAWFVLPLVAFGGFRPFEGEAARLVVILLIVVGWGVLNALLRAGRNSADQARLDALDRQEFEARVRVDADKQASEAAFAEIRLAARRALRRLRGRRLADILLGRRRALPRYLVIGPPGSGKSSMLAAADLNLPYDARAAELEAGDPPCRFLVSDGAVFVDAAGDLVLGARPAWAGLWPRLLDLLRAARPGQPVNGVLLVISATELAALGDEERAELARALRARLDEVTHRLRVRTPVYVLLSKLDRVPGFAEFFENLGAEERAQIWGVALKPLDAVSAREAARVRFGHDFDDLVRRAATRQLSFLHAEPDALRRTLAFEFPAQLASLRDRLTAFLEDLARQNRFDEPPLLRGVFLSSALQDGAAVDAIGGPLAQAFAVSPAAIAARPGEARMRRRGYFLKRLFGEIIPGEAGSGGLSRRARLALRLRTYGVRAAAAGIVTAGGLLLWSAYQDAGFYVTQVIAAADLSRASLARLSPGAKAPQPAAGFAPTLAALNDLGGLDAAAAAPAPDSLVNVAEIRPAAAEAYRGGLTRLLVPLTLRALEARLTDPASPAALRFQCLKLYLLLGAGRRPPAALMAELGPVLAGDWLGPAEDPVSLQRAVGHLVALSDVSVPPQAIDDALVAQTRRRLTGTTVAQIGYEILRQQPALRALRPWRPVDHAGSLGPRAVARASGASLAEGVRGLYTAAGLSEASPAAGAIGEALAADAWVFGPEAADQPNLAPRAIQSGILDLYRADYVRAWETLLADLTVPPLPTAAAAADLLAILNGPASPIVQLLTAVVAETSLDREVSDGVIQGIKLQAGASSLAASPIATSPITAALLPKTSVAALMTGPRQLISRQFAPLREAVTRPKEGQDSEVDAVLKSLDPLYKQLLIVAAGASQPDAPIAPPGAVMTQAAINRLPVAIRPYFTRLAADAAALVKYDVRGRAAQAWAANVRPACQAIVTKAFPFDLRAKAEVPLADFTRLFSPNGLIAGFRRTQLANLVDTSSRPWRWREGRALPSDPPDPTLAMFEQAEAITAAFFAEGDRPAVRFTLEPVRLDPKADTMQFDIGGASLTYAHGPEVPFTGQWPPPIPNAPATLSLRPEMDGTVNALVGDGPWGLFRLVAQGRFAPSGDAMLLAFEVGRRGVRLKVTTPTLKNPFDLRQMTSFKCPEF
ncbi:type VI secretion system membrane subunit TssM [Methylobacterium sp. NEAU 140]|uniref:type VI secretion system membrane subunit TssM n=1 Tax=Methylobacterium sp. NEAU 140 TaxID=3064945 RepID=UPI0027341F31|nr:type VI secretion system membrane subunit TssM [Methylobacterium sp. NEAU 140]MDP4025138.1 type VI secretion system membrane subunit TssM [Methylobacterium sp. NEAU 140]